MQPALLEEILNKSTPVERLLELASYDSTPAECLCFLAKSRHNRVIKAVAQNPNTPPDVLKDLFGHFPSEVLNNPIIDLLLLENPNFIEELYNKDLNYFINKRYKSSLSIFYHKKLPSSFLEEALKKRYLQVYKAVAQGKYTPDYILDKLAKDKFDFG